MGFITGHPCRTTFADARCCGRLELSANLAEITSDTLPHLASGSSPCWLASRTSHESNVRSQQIVQHPGPRTASFGFGALNSLCLFCHGIGSSIKQTCRFRVFNVYMYNHVYRILFSASPASHDVSDSRWLGSRAWARLRCASQFHRESRRTAQ